MRGTDIDPLSLDFATRYPDSFSRVLGRGGVDECTQVIESLPDDLKAGIAARLPATHVRHLLASTSEDPSQWLKEAPFDDAINFLSRIPRDRRLSIVNAVSDRNRQRQLLRHQQYPTHSVGALVGDIPMRISAETPAEDALAELRKFDDEDPGPLIVVDTDGQYVGVLDRWRLLMDSPPIGHVSDYVIDVRPVRPETPIGSAAMIADWHTRNWLPVVDHRRRPLGAVSRARLFRAATSHSGESRPAGDLFVGLLIDLVYVLQSVLDKGLSRRGSA